MKKIKPKKSKHAAKVFKRGAQKTDVKETGAKVIVDLDGVIFNSRKFKGDLFKFISKYSGASLKEIDLFYEKTRPLRYEKFFENFFKSDFRRKIIEFERKHKIADYLFAGTHKKLRALSRSFNLILLSYGHKSWQRRKIIEGKLAKYFEQIIVTSERGKHSDLSKLLKKHKISHVIDDSKLVAVKARSLGLKVKSKL
jgi:FMN phosphatase YigB (HAD superfamily)